MKTLEQHKLDYSIIGLDLSEEASIWFENLGGKEQGDIEYEYKEMLIEQGYDRNTTDNTSDGREEFLVEKFLDL